jgi:hypothetical protein
MFVTALAPGSGTPTGTVTLTQDATTLATFTLGSGPLTFTTSYPSATVHTLVASYSGDTNFTASSFTLKQVIKKDATTTIVSSAPNPSTVGQVVTYTATVTANAPGAGLPTGTVTFMAGKFLLGTAALDGTGQTILMSSGAPLGISTITAVYNGDTNFLTSTGTTLQTVNSAAVSSTLIATNTANVRDSLSPLQPLVNVIMIGAGAPLPQSLFVLGDASSAPRNRGAHGLELALPTSIGNARGLIEAPHSITHADPGAPDVAIIDKIFSDL